MPEINIRNRKIGNKHKPLIITELGINHGGSLEQATNIAEVALKSGAEVIKHQTHIVEDEMSEEAKSIIPEHTKESIYQIIKKCSLSEEEEYKLMKFINDKGGIFISTPFSRKAVDRLEKFGVPAYKIGSGECNNYPLVEYIAKLGKPVILSTGMNTIDSIKPSVNIFRKHNVNFALLHCTNIYPTPNRLVRLGAITKIQQTFPDAVVGLSDHTKSIYTCLGAVALGASILEKHFTDKLERVGPDISASMTPNELKILINGSKQIYEALGDHKGPLNEEKSTISFAFASIVATREISPGTILGKENIFPRRPGGGDFGTKDYGFLFGKKAKKNNQGWFANKKNDIEI